MSSFSKGIKVWHMANGGHANNGLAPHATRLLREAVELCFAAGASQADVEKAIHAEVVKAQIKEEIHPGEATHSVREEMGDVGILLMLLTEYAEVDLFLACMEKFDICLKRKWKADENGVLWRPE